MNPYFVANALSDFTALLQKIVCDFKQIPCQYEPIIYDNEKKNSQKGAEDGKT